MVKIWQVK